MARSVKVSITYCDECGYAPQTLALTERLMREFGSSISSFQIIPWHDGAFDVSVDGELVHSMFREGGFPREDDIVRAVRDRLAQHAAT